MEKKTVVITGGSAGIGLSIVEHLLAANYRVVNLSRRGLSQRSEDVEDYEIDLIDRDKLAALCQELAVRDVYGFVHNAGIIRADLIEDVSLDEQSALQAKFR